MNVKAFDPFVTEKELVLEIAGETLRIPFKTSTKEEVIRQSDFISLHASGNTELLTDEDFVVMKTGVGIINCARGGVIREQVLLGQLRSGKVSCAALDVFEQEPTGNLELLQHPKISLTPHIGASTLEAQDRIGKEIVEIITSFGF